MPDPLADVFGQLSAMHSNFIGGLNMAVKNFEPLLPHNVLASFGKGAGYFSAKTPTTTLNARNIFG
jgi:hypothetical protein